MANYDNIRLEKGLYTTGKGFTQALESLDPSENYIGTSLEGLDAYQRQLKRFDIKVSGKNSDSIEKFFRTTDSAALFPEYVSRAIAQGIEENDLISKVVATTTVIDSLDYRSLAIDTNSAKEIYSPINEGTFIPETTIKVKNNLVPLKKYGRMLTASYEAIKYQRLDLFTIALKQIGASIARTLFSDAVDTLMGSNDGSDTTTEEIILPGIDHLNYDSLLSLWSAFTDFRLSTIIMNNTSLSSILALDEFKDSAAGLNFHATGNLITPFGAEIINTPVVHPNYIVGLDKTSALEQVIAGGLVTDFDKLIDRQLERASVTLTGGFAKLYNEATKLLSIE